MGYLKVTRQQLYDLYWKQQLSVKGVARTLGVTPTVVKYRMGKLGVPLRTHKEAVRLASRLGRMSHFGESSPNWKGRRTKSKRGYIRVYAPGHPRAKGSGQRVHEHILVWEKTHNQSLPEGWLVHHLNGIKEDNRPENLIALPSKEHFRIIPALQQRIRELEEANSQLQMALLMS